MSCAWPVSIPICFKVQYTMPSFFSKLFTLYSISNRFTMLMCIVCMQCQQFAPPCHSYDDLTLKINTSYLSCKTFIQYLNVTHHRPLWCVNELEELNKLQVLLNGDWHDKASWQLCGQVVHHVMLCSSEIPSISNCCVLNALYYIKTKR